MGGQHLTLCGGSPLGWAAALNWRGPEEGGREILRVTGEGGLDLQAPSLVGGGQRPGISAEGKGRGGISA